MEKFGIVSEYKGIMIVSEMGFRKEESTSVEHIFKFE